MLNTHANGILIVTTDSFNPEKHGHLLNKTVDSMECHFLDVVLPLDIRFPLMWPTETDSNAIWNGLNRVNCCCSTITSPSPIQQN